MRNIDQINEFTDGRSHNLIKMIVYIYIYIFIYFFFFFREIYIYIYIYFFENTNVIIVVIMYLTFSFCLVFSIFIQSNYPGSPMTLDFIAI